MRKSLLTVLITAMLLNLFPAAMVQAADGTMNGWWVSYANITQSSFPVTLDNTTSYKGQWSVKISNSNPYQANHYGMLVTRLNGLEKGKTYKISSAIKSQKASAKYFNIGWKQNFSINLATTHDWTNMDFMYTHNSDTTSEDFMLIVDSAADGIWIDEVSVREVLGDGEYGENLITNSGFEVGGESNEETKATELSQLYDKIMQSDTFALSDMKKVLGAFKFAPVYKAEGIEIDGDMSDWEGYPQFGLPTKPDQYHVYIQGSNRDATGYCQYAYDEENLYLGIVVNDDVFKSDITKEWYWTGDSIQLAICGADETYDAEIGFSHDKESGQGYVFSSNYGDDVLKNITLKTSLEETADGVKIIYEAAIPWSIKYGDEPLPKGILFDVIINDNDGAGRAYCVELAPGIAEGKSSAEFPYLEFMTDKKDFYGWADGDTKMKVDEEKTYNYYFVNEGASKTVEFSLPQMDYTETVNVPANTCIRKEFKVKFSERGNNRVQIIASCNGESAESTVDVYVEPISSSFDDMLADLNKKVAELKSLLDQCEEKGIATDYPLVDYTTIKQFAENFIPQDIGWQMYDRTYAEYDQVCELYERAKEELNAYLDGSKTPFTVTRYVTGSVRTDGAVIYANTVKDGVVEERPFWFTGYGHFENCGASTAIFKDLGHSIIQIGMEPAYTIGEGSGGKLFSYNESPIVQRYKQYFKEAEDNDVQICLLLGVHYIPDWVYTKYSEIVGKSVEDVIVQQGTVKLHPIYKELLKTHIKGLMESFGSYKSLHSICLTNEPSNNCDNIFYQGYWAQYLTQLYDADINKLNEAYGTEYTSFLDVPMTTTVSETRQFYDYMQFNDAVMVEFHQLMADVVKEINPDMPLHAKVMTLGAWRDDPGRRNFLTYGTDYEKYSVFSDYGGNDASGYIQGNHWTLMDKLLNYDMLTGVKDVPAFNTEDHIIMDRDMTYTDPRYKKFVETDQWQGALHGRGASTMWCWARSGESSSDFMGLFQDRPDCVATAGRTAHDINRLNYEMEAMVKAEPKVAILYSQEARMWNNAYMNIMDNAYENCLYNGQKVEFVYEGDMAKAQNYDVFIIPNATNVKDTSFDEIKKYVENGGRLVVLGEDSLIKDELNNTRDENAVKDVMSKATVIPVTDNGIMQETPTKTEMLDILHNIFVEEGIQNIEVVDAATGERVNNCEFEYVDYNGNKVLNIVNYTWEEPKTVKIMINGKAADNMKELRKDVVLDSAFTVEPYEPMMIQIGGVDTSAPAAESGKFTDVNKSHWANEAVEKLAEKNIVSGYDDNTFKPDGQITREEFVKLLVSALNINLSDESCGFDDVKSDAWFAPYVNAAVKDGLTDGITDTTFGIGQKITREQMAVMVRRAVSEVSEIRPYSEFDDSSEISDYAKTAVKELYSAGIINGFSNTQFSPKTIVTRAQAAKIIYDAFVK